jgi:hypothetical protein
MCIDYDGSLPNNAWMPSAHFSASKKQGNAPRYLDSRA